ncbi:MAG TPA: hypothetical protein VLA88_03195 [Candidatus Saccharimonadales bacterium]|nr:hypothetical protein [Candidatus Saccharimonadales bacterium]
MQMRRQSKFSIPKSVVITLASILVLLVLLVGGGIAYVWYMGQHPAPSAMAEEPVVTVKKVEAKPKAVDPNAAVGVSVQSINAASPGENASITVRTYPEAECTIAVEYNKIPAKDSGLIKKNADEFGMATWAWTVDAAAPLGKWPVKVTCAHHGKSGMVQGDLEVTKDIH